jgi:hypothetical protein
MASIKSLYEQASHIDRPQFGLQRHNPNNFPIIGSLPVQIDHEQGKSKLDDIVLTGRVQAAFTDENRTALTTNQSANESQKDNQFLAIRQAVIAAGDEKELLAEQPAPSVHTKSISEAHETGSSEGRFADKLPAQMEEQTFASQLASLIDSEIERRLAERVPNAQSPNKKRPAVTRRRKKQKMPAKSPVSAKRKTARKSKQKVTTKIKYKKPSTKKRKQPK